MDAEIAIRSLHESIAASKPGVSAARYTQLLQQSRDTPRTPDVRLYQSLNDQPTNYADVRSVANDEPKTYLYLAYGSNLCALTFLERRQIRPLSQVNVVVPEIRLTFDLPGQPYVEPCFGNCEFRNFDKNAAQEEEQDATTTDYHKNRWQKGLVGVVYEVTASDYAHIIATEGGGASYNDILVDCYSLVSDPSVPVPMFPTGTPFKAHTLFTPNRRKLRSDPSYAQPTARYMKLLTDGAHEHDLPNEYKDYLEQIRTYHATTTKQDLGRFIFLSVWGPIFAFLFLGGGRVFLKPDGRYPKWYARMVVAIIVAVWRSYDSWFKPTFGDGERTIGDETDMISEKVNETRRKLGVVEGEEMWSEKTPLLSANRSWRTSGWNEPGTRGGDEMV